MPPDGDPTHESSSARSLLSIAPPWGETPDGRPPFFVSDKLAPRRRRASDFTRLVIAAAVFLLLGWGFKREPPIDVRVLEFFAEMPDWVRTIAWCAYTASAIAAILMIVATFFAGGVGRGIFRDLFVAIVLIVVFGLIGARTSADSWPNLFPEMFDIVGRPAYPSLRPALIVAVALVIGPHVNATIQRLLQLMIVSVVAAPIVLGVTTITALCGGLALSVSSVAVVRLIFGSPEGLPAVNRLTRTLESAGIEVTDVAYSEEQPGTVGLASARSNDGRTLDIKIYGVDAAERQRAERRWRALWYRSAGPSPRAGRAEQAQHEALAILTARDAGVAAPAIVGAGQNSDGDVLLVSVRSEARLMSDVDSPDELSDADLRATWSELAALHGNARIAHGRIGLETVGLRDGEAEFIDYSHASLFPTEQQLATDVVSMIVTQEIVVGEDRALDAAFDAVDRDIIERSLPYAQEAVLAPELRSAAKSAGVKVKDLPDELAARLDIEAPELESVRRVSGKDIAIAIAAVIAANALISQIADVGIDTILEELQDASLGWLVVAFLIKMVSYSTAYIGLKGIITQPLPFMPTALLQSAKSFVGLVVPSLVGRVGMDIRFLQKQGVPTATATTQGPVISLFGLLAEILLLLVSSYAIGQEVETDGLIEFDAGGLVAIAVLVVVIGLIVVFAVPKFRNTVVPFLEDAWTSLKNVITSPRAIGLMFGSELLNRLLNALSLGATVAAFGADLSFAALVFVSVGTGLLAGIAPVPGGIGVAEATMSGLLTAAGLPAEQAVAIAIVHRLVTAYLPPILGFFSFNWLTREGYL